MVSRASSILGYSVGAGLSGVYTCAACGECCGGGDGCSWGGLPAGVTPYRRANGEARSWALALAYLLSALVKLLLCCIIGHLADPHSSFNDS